LDSVAEKNVPVRVEVLDSTAFGYDWQTPFVDPITVTVRGPETQVEQVTSVRAEVFLRNAKNQVERTQTVVPQNSQGQAVTRVIIEPTVVHIIVPVEPWPGRKEVAVRVSLEGQPSAGYRLSTVRVNPSTVVLLGGTEALAQVPGFVETEPLSVAGATSEIQRRLQLIVPDSVTVLEGTAVDVTASIAAIEGGTTVRQRPVVQGLGPGLEAVVPIDTLDVILSGPLPLLESLGPDDIFVIVDLTGLLPGNHIVTPRVVVPTGIRAEGVLPESVEVSILAPSAATPTATSIITATLPGTVTGTATITVTPGSVETSTPTRTPTRTPSGTPAVSPTMTPTPAAVSPITRTATPVPASGSTGTSSTGTPAPSGGMNGAATPEAIRRN
jgi:YbbR domain-containing protein